MAARVGGDLEPLFCARMRKRIRWAATDGYVTVTDTEMHDARRSGNLATVEPCRIRAPGVIKYGWMMATGEEKEVRGRAWLAR